MPAFLLAKDGDALEQQFARTFLSDFPAYEQFWISHVAPLTNRPHNINAKTDVELALIGKGPEDIAITYLHYTVLRHLTHCYQNRRNAISSIDAFTNCMIRLSSSLDPADELLSRWKNRGRDPWCEKAGEAARRAWRVRGGPASATEPVRRYRNKLLHGRINPTLHMIDPTSGREEMWAPKLNKEGRYADWRSEPSWSDFAPLDDILLESWSIVTGYLEHQWQTVLLK